MIAIFVALLCTYALITPNPALATSILTAEAAGGVSAGAVIGTPTKVITPGADSLAVTFGDAAATKVGATELSANLLGSGVARYGALAGRARAEVASSPPGPFGVGGQVVLSLGFHDTAEIVSSTLAPGTPVTLTFLMTLDGTAFHFANGSSIAGRIGAAARSDATILDIEAGTGTPTFGPFTLVNSVGDSVTLTTFEFATAIGHHLQIDVGLLVAAGAIIEPFVFPGQASAGTAEVIADHTANFFYEPSGDVRLVSESGHDYAQGSGPGPTPAPVPEPASITLFGVGAATLLGATRWRARVERRSRNGSDRGLLRL